MTRNTAVKTEDINPHARL